MEWNRRYNLEYSNADCWIFLWRVHVLYYYTITGKGEGKGNGKGKWKRERELLQGLGDEIVLFPLLSILVFVICYIVHSVLFAEMCSAERGLGCLRVARVAYVCEKKTG